MDAPMPVSQPEDGLEHDPKPTNIGQQESESSNSLKHNSIIIDNQPPPINISTKPPQPLQRAITHQSVISTVTSSRNTQDDPSPFQRELSKERLGDNIELTKFELDTGEQLPKQGGGSNAPALNPDIETVNENPRIARWLSPRQWIFVLVPLSLCLLAAFIAVIVVYKKSRADTPSTIENLVVTISTVAATLPLADTAVGSAAVVFGVDSQTAGTNKTILAFDSGGKLCIRNFSNGTWSENVQCVSDTNMKTNSPISVLDWIGGPSVYFIDKNNFLSGIDYVPQDEGGGWKLSSLATQKRQANDQSKLATVAWLGGYSSWLYYQDVDNQLREFGIDDYRDLEWRDGSIGPLGACIQGSGIGAARYTVGTQEYLEVYTQTSNDAIHGRLYAESVWTSTIFSVDSTTTSLSGNAGLTATTVFQNDQQVVLLAYIASNQFLTIQARDTVNVTAYNSFSPPEKLYQGDGNFQTGIAATGSSGSPNIIFEDSNKIILLSAENVSVPASSWTPLNLNLV